MTIFLGRLTCNCMSVFFLSSSVTLCHLTFLSPRCQKNAIYQRPYQALPRVPQKYKSIIVDNEGKCKPYENRLPVDPVALHFDPPADIFNNIPDSSVNLKGKRGRLEPVSRFQNPHQGKRKTLPILQFDSEDQ